MDRLLGELVELGKTVKFNGQLDYGEGISSDAIFEAMKIAATEESSKEVIDGFLENGSIIHQTLLSISLTGYLQSTTSTTSDPSESLKKSRRSIRFLLNLVQRCPEFASKIPSDAVEILETLLATSIVDSEILLLLVKTADFSYLEFQKSPRYSHFLSEILMKIQEDGDNSSIFAYFSTLFEKDYAFLSSCYADMNSHGFCGVLHVLKGLLDMKTMKIHQNNLLFVINLLELVVVDYGAFLTAKAKKDPKSVENRRANTVEIVNLVLEIVGEMCTNTEMTSHLNEKATAINAVVDILDTILHSESLFAVFRQEKGENWPEVPSEDPKFDTLRKKIEDEKRYENTQRKYSDRPKQPPPPKIPRIHESESLNLLSQTILEQYSKIEDLIGLPRIGEMKLNCLKAIANLSSLSASNKLATVQNGRQGLLSVLQCTSRRPEYFQESYAMRNWAIFCVRQLTDQCNENKEVILNLPEPEQPIIDRKRLLREFGIDESELC